MSTADKRGGILIFLPGVHEIRQCIEVMRKLLTNKQANIFPLHANLSNDEQRLVFAKTSDWKIIVATNVAEVRRSHLPQSCKPRFYLPSDIYHY
jgi:ATP-dependent RNA helicase DHX57